MTKEESQEKEAVMKVCTGCKEEKSCTDEFFYRSKKNSSGFLAKCKDCLRKINKEYYHRPEIRQKVHIRRTSEEHKEKDRIYNRQEYVRERKRKAAKTPKRKAKQRHYTQTYKARKKLKPDYEKNKRAKLDDPRYKVRNALHKSIKRIFTMVGYEKQCKTFDIIMYTPQELINHLNKGKYTIKDYMKNKLGCVLFHIDHIIPLDYFIDKLEFVDGKVTEESKKWIAKANNLRNLRVWPAGPNCSKGSKINKELIAQHGIEDLLTLD